MSRLSCFQSRVRGFAFPVWAMAAAWAFGLVALAGADQSLRLGLEDLTRRADVIVVGRVQSKDAVFADRLIQTRYVVAADQYLKGALGQTIQLTQVGGTVDTPLPLTQRVEGAVELFHGEKALLFLDLKNSSEPMRQFRQSLRERAKAVEQTSGSGAGLALPQPVADSPLLETPLILGGWQGRFTIFKDQDGVEQAVQMKSELGGLATNAQTLELLRATANRPGVAQAAAAQLAARKEAKESASAPAEQALPEFTPPEALRGVARTLDELKAEIRTYVERQKADGLKRAPAPAKPVQAFPRDLEGPSQ